jgi:hypothetical protein
MRNTRLVFAFLVSTIPAFAQGPPSAGSAWVDGNASTLPEAGENVYIRGEYLLWITTTRRGLEAAQERNSNPLVNTMLTATGTTDPDLFQAAMEGKRGYRLTAGYWLDPVSRVGVEASGFWLNRDGLGTPATPASFFATAAPGFTGAGGGGVFAVPVGVPGVANAALQLNLGDQDIWGAEVLGRQGMYDSEWCRVDALIGARCLTFEESLGFTARVNLPGISALAQTGVETRSTYIGGLVGLDAEVWHGSWFAGARPRVTVACVENEVIRTTQVRATAPVVGAVNFDSAVLGQPRQRAQAWTVMPELDLRAGKQIGDHVRVMVGASVLVLPGVARASGQINPGLPLGAFVPGGGLLMPPQHETLYLFTMSAGVEVRF